MAPGLTIQGSTSEALAQALAVGIVARRRRDVAMQALESRCNELDQELKRRSGKHGAGGPEDVWWQLGAEDGRGSPGALDRLAGQVTCAALWHAAAQRLPPAPAATLAGVQAYLSAKECARWRAGNAAPLACAASVLERSPVTAVLEVMQDGLELEERGEVGCGEELIAAAPPAEGWEGDDGSAHSAGPPYPAAHPMPACVACLCALLEFGPGAEDEGEGQHDTACVQAFARWLAERVCEQGPAGRASARLLDCMTGAASALLPCCAVALAEALAGAVEALVAVEMGPTPGRDGGPADDPAARCVALSGRLRAALPRLPAAAAGARNPAAAEAAVAGAVRAVVGAAHACALVSLTQPAAARCVQQTSGVLVRVLHQMG
ncbi:hypothetical protein ACKKBG_A35360 [Auxenochlorella protothecoides x Auxenochlorella symbiontica]